MTDGEHPGWKLLASEEGFKTPYLTVKTEFVATPSRPQGVHWTVVHRPTASVVAPRTPDGRYILVKQERVAVRRGMWEFPAGQIDGEVTDESIRETALRELGEETGMKCTGELIGLGHFFPSVGFTTECSHLFLATGVVPCEKGSKHDEHEAILEVRAFTYEELRDLIAKGIISDANTLSTFARLQARGLLP